MNASQNPFRRLFGGFREGFGRQLYTLVLPIVIQNLITSAVSMMDVVMLGQVDQTSLAASSLASQVQFLLNIVYFGLSSALVILASQYWGKRDRKTIAKILGIGLTMCVFFSTLATVLALLIPGGLMKIWTNDKELAKSGAVYLRYVALSYFFAGFSQPYLAIMKSCERVKLSTVISSITMGLNVILNAILIFGLLGFPAMGIMGAALATSISRGVELVICLFDFGRQKLLPKSLKNMFAIPKALIKDFAKYSLPAFGNDALWGLAFNMNSIIMGRLGSDIVAANSVMTVARDLVTTVGFAISSAASILLGKEIGAGDLEKAKQDASSIVKVTLMVSAVQGLILLLISPIVPQFVKISDTAKHYLQVMLVINTVYQVGMMYNTVTIASLFRCGGDSRYGLILDTVSMWGVAVPLGLLAAFVLKLPPLWVYVFMCADEFVKLPFSITHYKKGTWVRNLTRDFE